MPSQLVPSIDPHDWDARAEEALTRARKMKPGPARAEALKKAGQLQVAADLKRRLSKSTLEERCRGIDSAVYPKGRYRL